jgi:hypothetical protein
VYLLKARAMRWTIFSFCFVLISALITSAQVVTVGCAGSSGTYDFVTLASALAAPNVSDIIVSGTCTETSEWITGRQLTIAGTPGAAIASVGGSLATKSPLLRLKSLILEDWMIFASEGNVELENVIIRHAGHGLEIWKAAQLSMTATVIEDSGVGISVRPGGHVFLNGSNTIRNNQIGITADGGTAWIVWSNEISNNQYGIRLLNGASATIAGPLLLTDNSYGIALTSSSVTLNQQSGAPILSSNGIAGDSNSGAIIAEGNSHVDLFDSQVINNHSHAIIVRDNSTIRTANDTITGNAGNGLRLLTLSSAHIYGGTTMTGNGGGDLACSLNSFASGYKSGIGKMTCLTFTPSNEAPLWW